MVFFHCPGHFMGLQGSCIVNPRGNFYIISLLISFFFVFFYALFLEFLLCQKLELLDWYLLWYFCLCLLLLLSGLFPQLYLLMLLMIFVIILIFKFNNAYLNLLRHMKKNQYCLRIAITAFHKSLGEDCLPHHFKRSRVALLERKMENISFLPFTQPGAT